MPDFETVSMKEAKLRTISGRQRKYLNEYADYIHQLPTGQAGKLHPEGNEKPATLRHRLVIAAQVLGINLVIKRSGEDIYFWSEDREDKQPRTRRSYTRRNRRGRAGDYFPPPTFSEPDETEQGITEEKSPELGQLASEAERRVVQG
jgi:hypothetical protein